MTLHRTWSNRLISAATARVEVVFGRDNRLFMLENLTLEPVVLWTNPPVTVHLLYSDHHKASIDRLIIFAHHPEHFYKNISRDAALEVDKQLKVANALAGLGPRTSREAVFFTVRSVIYDYKEALRQRDKKRKKVADGEMELTIKEKVSTSSATDQYRVRDLNQRIPVRCNKCGYERTDCTPSFWRKDTRFYIVVATSGCPTCKPKKSLFLPTDPMLPWVRPELKTLKVSKVSRIGTWNKDARKFNEENKENRGIWRPIVPLQTASIFVTAGFETMGEKNKP